jgi:hypothetical protein
MRLNYYHKALIVAAVAIFYTNVPLYLYQHYGMMQTVTPKHWVLLFCLFSLPVLIGQGATWSALKSPVALWCYAYACLTVLWFFQSSQSDLAWQEVRWRYLAVIEILAFVMIFGRPGATRLAGKTLVVAVLTGVTLNIYEVFAPLSFSYVIGRSAGLYQNPNMAGEALVLGMILSVTILGPVYRGPFILLTGIGTLATLSRAAILTWVIAVAGLILLGGLRLKDFLVSGAVGLLLVVLVLFPRWDQLLTTWASTGIVNVNVQERLEWITDPFGVSDQSGWERKYLAQRAWDKIAERPFLGRGTGSSYEAGIPPHNQYLSFMLDHGLLGVMIVPLLILAMTWGARGEGRRVAIVFGCAILVLSFFTHNVFNFSYSLILFSLMAAMAAKRDQYDIKGTMAMETGNSGAAQVFATLDLSPEGRQQFRKTW